MNIVHETSVLVASTKSGKNKYWQGIILEDSGVFYTQTNYWQQDGANQLSEPKVVSTTNVGKTNERGGFEQAQFNMDSLVVKQQDKGYSGEGVEKLDIVLPMLANKWADKKHLITFPVMVQPKLDGVRMLMQDGRAWSRKGKEFPEGVLDHILMNTNGMILDGELILDGTFQDTMRAVKKGREESKNLVFHVFDIVEDSPFLDRLGKLTKFIHESSAVKLVPTYTVLSEEELINNHSMFIQEGYEGTIIRTFYGVYLIGHRSSDLLKMKDFDDAEFTIVDVEEGEGRDTGAAIFVCTTDFGDLFRVRPRGTMEYRQDIFQNSKEYLGKALTVRYQGVSESGIPRFPVGTAIRDYE